MATATKELLELDGTEGKPLDLLKKVLDTLNAKYEVPTPKEGDNMVREYHRSPEDLVGIHLDPFLEPNSVLFFQQAGDFTLITTIEQLSKVKCISFRTQLSEGKKLIAKCDLINDPGTIEDKTAGRILVRVKGKDLYLLFEAKPGGKVGQCEASYHISNCLTKESPMSQTLDIRLFYKGDNTWTTELTGKISVWNF